MDEHILVSTCEKDICITKHGNYNEAFTAMQTALNQMIGDNYELGTHSAWSNTSNKCHTWTIARIADIPYAE